ncbi:amino acid ABC transporter substrate-binding protein [Parasedimentitalea maritima]|uniref:Amino acid ABC transporter substrate-binding protein n=1 Tax=Parasedimentitalea maritima TaxID=2578117 RepID=A0ABY2UT99_9RHOB|nr:transporter substrate-binding domain-containing protein [Zongyanglinia marina]TLP60459.1 amino acid ABC transporter substrate-binding protein [Zongyanglinia marina]
MRPNFSLTALLSAMLLSTSPAFAELVRYATIDYAPYALHDDPQGRLGLFVDINTAIADRAELNHSDTLLPISRVIKNLEHDVSDCGVFLLTSISKEAYIPVAKILDRFDTIIISRPGLKITQEADLSNQRLAIPRGSFEGSTIATDPNIDRVLTNNAEQSVHLLKAGRVDAIAGTSLNILYQLSLEGMSRNEIGDIFTYERQEVWLQCAKNQLSEETITKLRQATDALRLEGVFDTFVRRYISEAFSSPKT